MKASVIRTVAVVLGLPGLMLACSALAVVKDGRVLLGGNNDTSYADKLKLRATPGTDGLYGRVCISSDPVPGWSSFGTLCLNDRGLAVTHANTPPGGLPHDPDKPHLKHNFIEKVSQPVYEYSTDRKSVPGSSIRSGVDGTFALSVVVPDADHQYEVVLLTKDDAGHPQRRSIVAGKAVSAYREAYQRFLMQTMVTGQAAGVAAALCAKNGVTPRMLESDVSELQRILVAQGAILTGTH